MVLRLRHAAPAVILALLLSAAPAAFAARTPRYRATVTRDSAGIPHIRASDFGSLGYGQGYAFAQDNLCTLADAIVTVRAQRSRFFGPNALSYSYAAGVSDPNIKSDFFWQSIRTSGLIRRLLGGHGLNSPRREIRSLYAGFAAGYNAFLRSGKLRDPRCKGKPWVTPITMTDLWLRGIQIATFASSSQFISALVDAQPPAAGALAAGARSAVRPDIEGLRRTLGDVTDPTLGSNAIGLGSQGTQTRDGMLLANPHFPWRGPERFWMAQLTVPGSYDVLGGTLHGFPLIGIGFNRHMAWTHTVSTSRRFTVFQLKLAPGDPTSYIVDGKTYRMGTRTVTVAGRRHTFYTTRYGTVFNLAQAGFIWTRDTAYALGDAVLERGGRTVNEYLAMGRASSVRRLLAVLERYAAIPAFNTVAADDTGTALYGDIGATPNVTQQKIDQCTPDGAAKLVFAAARVITLDGSRSSCNWGTDRGAPAGGLFAGIHLPHLIRRDYVENSNDSYWLANPAHPLRAFSPIVGLTRTAQGLRTRLGNQMIAARLAGRDGLGRPRFSIATLQRMWQNDRSLAAELLLDPLVAACRANPQVTMADGATVDVSQACGALAGYDKTGNLDAKGGWLFSEWFRRAPTSTLWATPFDPARPLDTPSGLNTANPANLQALGAAVSNLRANGIPLDAPYRNVQHATRGSLKVPIHGCSSGCFQNIAASSGLPAAQNAPYGEVYTGSSLVMTTELTRRGPRAQGILTFSQAEDPTSPWFANLTKLFSRKRWVPLRYTPAALRRDSGSRTLNLAGG
jgi:acyl-homoserine-lactone acylase